MPRTPQLHVCALLMALACGACASASPSGASSSAKTAASDPAAPAADRPPPRTCLEREDCPEGVCEGQGCSDAQPGHCAPAVRACTKDLSTYCGCDGRTFRTSGSCPGRRYRHRGPCEPADGLEGGR